MLTFPYKVGGWVWQNAYVIKRLAHFLRKYQIDLRERLPEFALFLIQRTLMTVHFSHLNQINLIYNLIFFHQKSVKHIFENEFKLKFFEFLKVSKSQKNFFLYSNTYILKKNQHFLYISALALKKWLTQFLVARAEINISLVFRSI